MIEIYVKLYTYTNRLLTEFRYSVIIITKYVTDSITYFRYKLNNSYIYVNNVLIRNPNIISISNYRYLIFKRLNLLINLSEKKNSLYFNITHSK